MLEADKEIRRLKLMTLGSKEGFWYWPDTTQNKMEWSDQFFILLGYQPQEFELYFADFESMLHHHDLKHFLHAISHSIASKSSFELEFRIRCKDGNYRWFLGRGSLYFNETGNVNELAGSISDIHNRKVLEQKLKKSNERYNQAIEAVGVGIWEWNIDTNQVYWSPAHYRLLGFAENEIEASFDELKNRIHEDDLQHVFTSLNAHLSTNQRYSVEYRILCKNNQYRWFKVSGVAATDDSGKALSMAGSLEDIHEKKTAELQIELANERFELATQGATVGVFDWYDIKNDKAYLSDRYLDLVGLTRGEIGGSFAEFSTLVHPEDRIPTYEHVQGVLAGKHPYNFEYRVLHKEKGFRWFHATAAVRRDSQGNAVQMIGSMQDIHERKQLERHLQESNERYNLALQGLSVGIWDWNIKTNNTFWSTRLREMLGVADNCEKTFSDFESRLHPDDKAATLAAVQAHIERKHPYNVEYRLLHEGGFYIWVRGFGQAAWDEGGNPSRMVSSIENITVLKQVEAEREQAEAEKEVLIAKLRTSNTELDQFAYVASHDLKAPLRVIDNASLWLEEDIGHKLESEDLENLQLIRSRALRMEKLLDDLLEFSRIGRKTDERYASYVSGEELLNNALMLVDLPEGFIVNIDKAFSAITVNQMPLLQIFVNLISNAIKHHDKDKGTISIQVKEASTHFSFLVSDDGPGIAVEYHEKIFGMFQTLQSRDRKEGSGMGLALVKKHIDLQGGCISIESDTGKGCTFKITWPKIQPLQHR